MSILQEYESIKSRMKPGEFEAIEEYLKTHTNILLSDLYYNEERYKEFYKWWKTAEQRENPVKIEQDDSNIIETDDMLQVYVDGSYNRDNDKTGAGVVILYDNKEYKKAFLVETRETHSWNIDGECHAVIEALKICTGESSIEGTKFNTKNITINYDYEGIAKWASREWKAKSVIARSYLQELNRLLEKYKIIVSFNKVKAHSGNKYNEIADSLAYSITQSVK